MATGQVVNGLAMATAAVVVATRVYLRIFKEKRYAPEEFLIILALIFYVVLGGIQAYMLGLLERSSTDPLVAIEVKTYFAFIPFAYVGSLYLSKLAIILFHIQLTEGFWVNKVAKKTMWAVVVLWPFTYILYSVGCLPFSHRWSIDPATACKPLVESWDFWATWAMHIGTDLMLVAIPFPALQSIKDLKLRLAISGVYALGLVGIVVSTVRIILMSIDPEKSIDRSITISSVETSVHIMVATIPGISSTFIKRYSNRSSNKGSSSGRSRAAGGIIASSSRRLGAQLSKSNNQSGGASMTTGEVTRHSIELEGSVSRNSSPFGASTDDIVAKQ
ncbi:hypothetical protein MKZ38_000490 [Zalerion maritima]|uniref:Rhodopsin domain-containing protein n=1 Tax=Zalerion maritima TaxID=339359 RepID=A0AAD5RT32_9PEZI|nr:hypothetical protein MKZ38_000490 [Zalerion maritima]